jgi:predicted RNase H-like nuclease (RuvC/YqgF family)
MKTGRTEMTRYERIRQEIIAIEREIATLRGEVKEEKEKESLEKICMRNERIRDAFSGVGIPRAV